MSTRMRVTFTPNGDRRGELQSATNLRHLLRELSYVEGESDDSLLSIYRDETGRAYLEFVTTSPDAVRCVIEQSEFTDKVVLRESTTAPGEKCVNCGNVAGPLLPTVCPNCNFRDVSPCPMCQQEISRESYTRISGDLFRCPNCDNQVRLRFNNPMFLRDGSFNPPLVLVEEVRAVHALR